MKTSFPTIDNHGLHIAVYEAFGQWPNSSNTRQSLVTAAVFTDNNVTLKLVCKMQVIY